MADKKENKQRYKAEQQGRFIQLLPIAEQDFILIFDYLDSELSEKTCKNNFVLLEEYCKSNNIDFKLLKKWLNEQGAYCDCEILANVEEQFEYIEKLAVTKIKQKKQSVEKQKLNELKTDFGFSIQKVPSPWILIETKSNGNASYHFQIGKKADFPLSFVVGYPVESLADDNFVRHYWLENRTYR